MKSKGGPISWHALITYTTLFISSQKGTIIFKVNGLAKESSDCLSPYARVLPVYRS